MTIREMLARGPLLSDGAWGTQLQARGLALGECPDAWNLSHPESVRAVAQSYIEAGSRVLLTNTFRASPIALAGFGLAEQMARMNTAGVEHSRSAAAATGAYVFASVGPSGKLMMAGEVTGDELFQSFRAQCEALAAAHPDALLLETMSDLEEAHIALAAAKATGLPAIVSFAFDTGKKRDRTMTGVTPEQAAFAMEEAGADAVGANCGNGIEAFAGVCARMRAVTTLPLWIKANAGMPRIVSGEAVYDTVPEDFAAHLPGLLAAGAAFVGGCCGTSPAFIRALGKGWLHAIPADRL
ncbi:MAG: homocysteine S-methyltransferase family protein [Bryobacterales bacterium]|nr:homocysteine S-methyltransferase family protein [Bryobacterales bacterium]